MLVRSRRWERPCPGDFGVLKAADPRQFLGPWLARRGVAVRGDPRRRRRWLPRGVPRLAAPLFALRTSGRAAACLRSLTRFEVMDGPFGCLCRRRRRLVRLAVRAGHHDGVPVGIPQPDLAMAGPVALAVGRVAVRWAYHGRVQLCDAGDDAVEVGHVTEPQQYAVPDRAVRVSHGTVMVLGPDVVQLQDEVPVGEQPLVLGAAVVAAQAEQLLVPTAGGFHVAYRDHGLGPGGTGQDDDSDPVAGRVVDLDEPAFPVVESGAAAYGAAVGDYLAERGLQLVGADPQDRAAGGGGLEVGGQLADHCGCLEAAVPQSDRPAEHRLVERRGPGYVECRELQVSDLAVRRRLDPAVDVGSSHGDLLLLAERGLDGGVSATSSRRAVRANQSWYRSTDQRRWRTSRSNTAGSISSHMVSTASCRVSSSCRSALPARPSTIHPAVIARCRIICSVSSASSGVLDDPSNTASTRPAERAWAAPTTLATIARNSSTLADPAASLVQPRSSTATGSSSPAIATSIAALSSRALVPDNSSTVGTETPASAAIARRVAPAYPRATNTDPAA